MGVLEQFNIDLGGMAENALHRDYVLDDAFFAAIGSAELTKGRMEASVDVRRISHGYEIELDCKGIAIVPCDRCLDDVSLDIEAHDRFVAVLRDGESDDDGLVYVDNPEGIFNVAWKLFEAAALALPVRRVHPDGQCNGEMDAMLCAYETDEECGSESDDEREDKAIDPRWEGLKKLLNNNK